MLSKKTDNLGSSWLKTLLANWSTSDKRGLPYLFPIFTILANIAAVWQTVEKLSSLWSAFQHLLRWDTQHFNNFHHLVKLKVNRNQVRFQTKIRRRKGYEHWSLVTQAQAQAQMKMTKTHVRREGRTLVQINFLRKVAVNILISYLPRVSKNIFFTFCTASDQMHGM